MAIDVRRIADFGKVDAEEDPVLDYFLATESHRAIADAGSLLVLGRKGSGKTALVRAFTEQPTESVLSRALKFRSYPWGTHSTRLDRGASEIEAYVASWEYLIAVELAATVYKIATERSTAAARRIAAFLKSNYGSTDTKSSDILKPDRLRLEGNFEPQLFGSKLGSISLTRDKADTRLGSELSALSDAIFAAIEEILASQLFVKTVLLHFDELDLGLSKLDENRSLMLIGLVLAGRAVRTRFADSKPRITPVIYLRTDLWNAFSFSDKNKITESQSISLEWNSNQLKELIEQRATAKLGERASWEDMEDGDLMRGAQTKWNHIIARTYLRPRDVIRFCNTALQVAKDRSPEPSLFTNRDITEARDYYSPYLRRELDDEIRPHWPNWSEAVDALIATQTLTFNIQRFREEYKDRRSDTSPPEDKALELLFDFSVIGYERYSGYGGSSWVYKYLSPDARWNPGAPRCKVHLGLKEYCRLKEERT